MRAIYFTDRADFCLCRTSGREQGSLRLCYCCKHNCNECPEATQGLETAEACSAWGLPRGWEDQPGGSACKSLWEPSGQDQPVRTNGSSQEDIEEYLLTQQNFNDDIDYINLFSLTGHYRFVWNWSPRGGRKGGRVCVARWSPIGCVEGWALGSLRWGKIHSIVFKDSR